MQTCSRPPRFQWGVSLIELMVSLVIGLFLILGAVTILNQSRNTYRASEGVARLQEIGRLAMDVVESDVRMARFWGMTNETVVIDGATELGGAPPTTFTATQQARSAVCGTIATGNYFVINLFEDVNGSNNSYTLTCAALNYQAATDALWLRRASGTRPTTMNINRIHVQTSHDRGWLFVPSCTNPQSLACIPDGADPLHSQSRELFAHIYYVSSRSTNRTDVPALRRKRFVNANGSAGAAFTDEEIVPGVEDLQVQFGVDGPDADTNVDQYVNPGAIPADSRVVSARIWLRIRAEDRDFGFVDDRAYQYADMAAAVTPNDNYRRILVTKTIHIRNSRELDE